MRRIKGFWDHLERLVHSVPEGPDGTRSCRLRAIEAYLQTAGYPTPADLIQDKLADIEPSFPWQATFDGTSYHFTPKLSGVA